MLSMAIMLVDDLVIGMLVLANVLGEMKKALSFLC
jgi:hypothetical protein